MEWDSRELDVDDYFNLLWDEYIIQTFLDATDQYATSSELKEPEFKTFLCCILFTGIVKLPTRDMLWRDEMCKGTWIESMITRYRFEEILSCWHWTNTYDMERVTYKKNKRVDPFFTVKPFLNKLRIMANKKSVPKTCVFRKLKEVSLKGKEVQCKCERRLFQRLQAHYTS